jgi:hypothetical protein
MFTDQIAAYLQTTNTATTRQLYQLALSQFHAWYTTTYAAEPDASLLTEEEGDHQKPGATSGEEKKSRVLSLPLVETGCYELTPQPWLHNLPPFFGGL